MKTKTKPKKIKPKLSKIPKITKGKPNKEYSTFPVTHYSKSSMVLFTSNPIMFMIKYVNRDVIDTTTSIRAVLGQAFHKAMEVYQAGSDTLIPTNEAEAIEYGLKAGMEFLERYNDGFIDFNTTIQNKEKAYELLAFAFNSYINYAPWGKEELVAVEEKLEEYIDVEWRGQRLQLPVRLKGYVDKIIRRDGKLIIKDYKTCASFSDPEKIDGDKILQAVIYYLLVYARYGEAPYSMIFEEVKLSKNRDGSPQVRQYEIVYEENDLFFDFFFRLYEDITNALNGKMVYVPNIYTLFDNEVSIIAYINRLDVAEEQAKLMKKHKVDNITELLKKKIQNAGNMRKLMKAVESKFTSAKNMDYSKMKNHEKIQAKLLEHGMMLDYDSTVNGATVDLYRYNPTIGLKMSKLTNYVADIEQILGVTGIRILAPIPNTTLVGFEVPKEIRTFPELPAGASWEVAIGQDIVGNVRRFDLREAPHLLVAGASGSGKSVFLSSLIEQLNRLPKDQVELRLYDPKKVELAMHEDDPNVTDYKTEILEINAALEDLVLEMNSRYNKLKKAGVRQLADYTKGDLPFIYVVIDEFGDLIMQDYVQETTVYTGHIFSKGERAGQEETRVEKKNISAEIAKNILLLAQKSRAAGIHLIVATQRPSTDVITGTIKANFPTKVAFRVAKSIDSIIILDNDGAEKLRGKGDMLFANADGIERLQGYKV